MYNISLAEDTIRRFCNEDKERPVHVLRHSESLARIRVLVLGTAHF